MQNNLHYKGKPLHRNGKFLLPGKYVILGPYLYNAKKSAYFEGRIFVYKRFPKSPLVGIHSSRWISTHGIALNCNIDLSWFKHFVPCGIEGKGVTSLSEEIERNIAPQEAISTFVECFQNVFDCTVMDDDMEDQKWNILLS